MISITKSKIFVLTTIASILLTTYFAFTSQFWAGFWSLAIPVGFVVLLFFLIVFIGSIVFWKKSRYKYRQSHIPFFINIIAIITILCIPSHNLSKQYYKGTGKLCNYKTGNCGCNLYAQYYNVYDQGAWGTGLSAEYLTDSVSFRKHLGVYDENHEYINIVCKGDSIIVTKTSSEFINTQWSDPKVLERKSYSLSELKRNHNFD